MGFCPDYPPCNMRDNDSASAKTLGRNFTTVNETGLKILDIKRNTIIEYDLQESVYNNVYIHNLVPKVDARAKLESYIGQYVIFQMEVDNGDKELEVIELKVLVTAT